MQIILNGQPKQLETNLTVIGLLETLGMAGRPVAVEINRELVPHANHGQRELADGDQVEVVTLVGGG
jgi:sulfur carrier protein